MREHMDDSLFLHLRFWLLILLSVPLPLGMCGIMRLKRRISPDAVLLLGLALVFIAGVDVHLLHGLATASVATPSLADDWVFDSRLSVLLYLLPVVYGGIGVNVISHALVLHLQAAEEHFGERRTDA